MLDVCARSSLVVRWQTNILRRVVCVGLCLVGLFVTIAPEKERPNHIQMAGAFILGFVFILLFEF